MRTLCWLLFASLVLSTPSYAAVSRTYKCDVADFAFQGPFGLPNEEKSLEDFRNNKFTFITDDDYIISLRQNPGQEPYPTKYKIVAEDDSVLFASAMGQLGSRDLIALQLGTELHKFDLSASVAFISAGQNFVWRLKCSYS